VGVAPVVPVVPVVPGRADEADEAEAAAGPEGADGPDRVVTSPVAEEVTGGVVVVGVGAGGSPTRTDPAPTAYPGPDARATDVTMPAATNASLLFLGRCCCGATPAPLSSSILRFAFRLLTDSHTNASSANGGFGFDA
jgi:hypothetical protein